MKKLWRWHEVLGWFEVGEAYKLHNGNIVRLYWNCADAPMSLFKTCA
jgi:hypothetical protein